MAPRGHAARTLARVRGACQYSAHAWTGRQGDQSASRGARSFRGVCAGYVGRTFGSAHTAAPAIRARLAQPISASSGVDRSSFRGVSLSDAVSVRRAHGRPRHAAERRLPDPHRRRTRGLGLRFDDAGQRLGLSRGDAGGRARRDARARARSAVRRPRPATSAAIPSICSGCSSRSICVPPPMSRVAATWRRRSPGWRCSWSPARSTRRFTTPTGRRSVSALRDLRLALHDARFVARSRRRVQGDTWIAMSRAPRAQTPVFHSIGASDPLEAADVRTPSATASR